jgi:IclR family acetate operon transcriptional repressor
MVSTDSNSARTSKVQSVERALSLLRVIGVSDHPVSLSDLARNSGLHPATAHRLLGSLVSSGFVAQDPKSALYTVGDTFLRLAHAQQRRSSLAEIALPVLQRLVNATGETAGLVQRENDHTVVIARVLSTHLLRVHTPIGGHGPLHATAVGLILLAYMPNSEREKILRFPLQAYTANTVTDPLKLEQRLADVRRAGYVIVNSEYYDGITNIACPIRDARAEVIAAVSISGPGERIHSGDLSKVIDSVVRSARELSHLIGAPADIDLQKVSEEESE